MRFSAKLIQGFKKGSFCYMCFPKKNLNPLLYVVNMTGHEVATSSYRLERQGYYTYLLTYTLSGKAKFSYQDRDYEINKGDLVFINCDNKHTFIPVGDKNWEFVYIHIIGLGVNFLYNDFISSTGNVFPSFPEKTFLTCVKKIQDVLRKCDVEDRLEGESPINIDIPLNDNVACAEISTLIYEMLIDINTNLLKIKKEIPYGLQKAVDFIKEHFTEKLTLETIAEHGFVSKFHFERLFYKHFKMTVFQFISDLRFERARWLLETTSMKIIDIAISVGYSDVQALTKLFKHNLNVTPAKYRQQREHYPR